MLKRLLMTVFVSSAVAFSAQAQNTTQPEYTGNYDFDQKEYFECTKQLSSGDTQGYIDCLNQEIKRQQMAINYFYENLLKQGQFQKWNNGNGMFKGNMKDMNDQYIAYRERLCSIFGIAMMNFYKNPEWGRKDCTVQVNEELIRRLNRLYGESMADYSSFDDFAPGTI